MRIHGYDKSFTERLQLLCRDLNALEANATLQGETWCRSQEEQLIVYENWKMAAEVINSLCSEHVPKKSKDHSFNARRVAALQFKKYFGRDTTGRLTVELDYDKTEFVCSVEPPQAIGKDNHRKWLGHELWSVVFYGKGYERLRRCRQCRMWFVSTAPNMRGDFCTSDCRDQYWTRDRRKKAGHILVSKKGKKP